MFPPETTQLVSFDDEVAGGTAHWYRFVPKGHPLPAEGDWVWGPEGCNEDGEPTGNPYTQYEVVRRGWTFTSDGSPNAQRGDWRASVRVHVRSAKPHEVARPARPAEELEVELRKPGGRWYPLRHFVEMFHVADDVEYRIVPTGGHDT